MVEIILGKRRAKADSR